MKFGKIFVTVGTTEFDSLIKKISESEVCKILRNHLECDELKLQIGNGEKIKFENSFGMKIEIFDLKPSIADDIEDADLVRN
jgi:UDP-N-acetylglucosamine transferase subunit ALG13